MNHDMTMHRRQAMLRAGLGLLLAVVTIVATCRAAAGQVADREVVFDRGLLRWKDTREEVALFGVNYYPPFHLSHWQAPRQRAGPGDRFEPGKPQADGVRHPRPVSRFPQAAEVISGVCGTPPR
ncbi:MAG: hypothetical protein ABSH34_06155 [Verrucomicrobiota bacterium]|jgi:hypothetical protein